jgi:hypothetical protein
MGKWKTQEALYSNVGVYRVIVYQLLLSAVLRNRNLIKNNSVTPHACIANEWRQDKRARLDSDPDLGRPISATSAIQLNIA